MPKTARLDGPNRTNPSTYPSDLSFRCWTSPNTRGSESQLLDRDQRVPHTNSDFCCARAVRAEATHGNERYGQMFAWLQTLFHHAAQKRPRTWIHPPFRIVEVDGSGIRQPCQASRTHNTSWDPRSILGGALELNQRIMAASTKWLQALWAVMLLVSILPGGVAAENNASARGPFSESVCDV